MLFVRFLLASVLTLFSLISSFSHATFKLANQQITAEQVSNLSQVNFADLCSVAEQTLYYLDEHSDDTFAVHGGNALLPFSNNERIKKTLSFICMTYLEDTEKGQNLRLQQANFLLKHFDFYRWYPDKTTADQFAAKSNNAKKNSLLNGIPTEQILLTKYYTKLLHANPQKTAEFNHALYALPFDEEGLSLEEAELKKAQLTRFKYTRQDIVTGVLAQKKLAEPLIWLSESSLYDVLLQGTGVVQTGDKTRYFNVHRNNGINYNYSLGQKEQGRYWYFAEVPSIMGYGKKLEDKIPIKPYVTFAGNVKQLGLGQLFLVNNPEKGQFSRLGILADQGGAFDNNLFQLDYLVGSYWDFNDYHQHNKHLPDYTNAWLLLLKE